MSNATWACFDCRGTVRRAHYTRATVLCPSCGESCRYLGHKLRLPPKRDARAWRELLRNLQTQAIELSERKEQARLRRKREIQEEIDRLEGKGPNEGRAKQVRLLRKELAKL